MAGQWKKALSATAALLCATSLQAGSLDWQPSTSGPFDYGRQLTLPSGFGNLSFTFEVWIRPDNSFPFGSTQGGGQLTNWSDEDFAPYSSSGWWFNGNFLLDGHNNANSNFHNGTFSLQIYGRGRVRWLFGDGTSGSLPGNLWAVQGANTNSAPSVVDGSWHHVALVRRCTTAGAAATLELWVDGQSVGTETTTSCPNMASNFWNNWTGFPVPQQGWFWGAEKQAALGSSWEDYKGLIDELRFWTRAKTSTELGATQYANPVTGSEANLVGWYDFNEGSGASTCRFNSATECMTLHNTVSATVWNAGEAPTTGGGGDTTAPTVPQNPVATPASSTTINLTWTASTDVGGTGVASYRVQRGGATVAPTVASTSYSDTGLTANTTYNYTISAIDVAGNRSAESTAAQATTPAAPADLSAPTMPGNFAATATSSTVISLSWTASTDNVGVTGYQVRRTGNPTVIASPTGLTFVDSGRTASTNYSYTVTAVDAAGNESPTASASATTLAAPSSSSGGGAAKKGGGSLDWATLFTGLALLLWTRAQRRGQFRAAHSA